MSPEELFELNDIEIDDDDIKTVYERFNGKEKEYEPAGYETPEMARDRRYAEDYREEPAELETEQQYPEITAIAEETEEPEEA